MKKHLHQKIRKQKKQNKKHGKETELMKSDEKSCFH